MLLDEDQEYGDLTIKSTIDDHITLENGEVEIPKVIEIQKENNYEVLAKAKYQLNEEIATKKKDKGYKLNKEILDADQDVIDLNNKKIQII